MNSIASNTLSSLPSLSGNLAIDVAVLILALATISRLVKGSSDCLYNAQRKKTKLLTLRKTLELRSVEVATLRATLMHMREDTSNDLHQKGYLSDPSQLSEEENLMSQQSQPETDLPIASRRPSDRYDA